MRVPDSLDEFYGPAPEHCVACPDPIPYMLGAQDPRCQHRFHERCALDGRCPKCTPPVQPPPLPDPEPTWLDAVEPHLPSEVQFQAGLMLVAVAAPISYFVLEWQALGQALVALAAASVVFALYRLVKRW